MPGQVVCDSPRQERGGEPSSSLGTVSVLSAQSRAASRKRWSPSLWILPGGSSWLLEIFLPSHRGRTCSQPHVRPAADVGRGLGEAGRASLSPAGAEPPRSFSKVKATPLERFRGWEFQVEGATSWKASGSQALQGSPVVCPSSPAFLLALIILMSSSSAPTVRAKLRAQSCGHSSHQIQGCCVPVPQHLCTSRADAAGRIWAWAVAAFGGSSHLGPVKDCQMRKRRFFDPKIPKLMSGKLCSLAVAWDGAWSNLI